MAWSIDRAYSRIGAKDAMIWLEPMRTVTYVDANKTRGRGGSHLFLVGLDPEDKIHSYVRFDSTRS